MVRISSVLLLLVIAGPAFAAAAGSKATLYEDVLHQLRRKPDSPTAMMALRPPSTRKAPAERAALDAIVRFLADATARNPKNFRIAYNYYLALWSRYLYYKNEPDAAAAFRQLENAGRLAEPLSDERARCALERAQNIVVLNKLDEKLAAKLTGGDWHDAAAKGFKAAKRAAMSTGPYAARAALALADLYIDYVGKTDAAAAKKYIREALELDKDRGYVTNQAYNRLGLVLLAEGNTEGAVTMLESAATVRVDQDIRSFGYAHRLARALIETGRYKAPIAYLQKAVALGEGGKTALNVGPVYTLALGYTKMGDTERALIYWKKYFDLGDADEARRKKAKKIANELTAPSTD